VLTCVSYSQKEKRQFLGQICREKPLGGKQQLREWEKEGSFYFKAVIGKNRDRAKKKDPGSLAEIYELGGGGEKKRGLFV